MQSAPLLVACGHEILGEIGRVLTLAPLRFGLLGEYSLDRKVYAD